ncbi:hypothetical protein CHCC20335_4140 [Bacillus paralicheniformis]|nr:hypothetical protein CHCC20335_4140 [Bacillus paralicheniformis]
MRINPHWTFPLYVMNEHEIVKQEKKAENQRYSVHFQH